MIYQTQYTYTHIRICDNIFLFIELHPLLTEACRGPCLLCLQKHYQQQLEYLACSSLQLMSVGKIAV